MAIKPPKPPPREDIIQEPPPPDEPRRFEYELTGVTYPEIPEEYKSFFEEEGIELPKGWRVRIGGGGQLSYITPTGWEIAKDFALSPEREAYTREQFDVLIREGIVSPELPRDFEATIAGEKAFVIPHAGFASELTPEMEMQIGKAYPREGEVGYTIEGEQPTIGGKPVYVAPTKLTVGEIQAEKDILDELFPEQVIDAITNYYFPQFTEEQGVSPEAQEFAQIERLNEFISEIREYGRTPEVETLLSLVLPEITEEELTFIFESSMTKTEAEAIKQRRIGEIYEKYGYEVGRAPIIPAAMGAELNEVEIQYLRNLEPGTLGEGLNPISRSLLSGMASLQSTIGGIANWLSKDKSGDFIVSYGQMMSKTYGLTQEEWDNVGWAKLPLKAVEQVPLIASIIIPSLATGGLASGVFGSGLLSFFASATTAGVVSRVGESLMEGGSAYNEAIAKGLSAEESANVASRVFSNNLQLAGLDVAQFATAFAPIRLGTVSNLILRGFLKTAMVGGKLTIVGASEGFEEYMQEIWTRQALGEPIEWDEEMQEVVSLGVMMGIGLGGVGDIVSNITSKTEQALPPELKEKYDAEVASKIAEGIPEQTAKREAMDVVAETPEGKKIIEAATEHAKIDAYEQILKPKTEADRVVIEHRLEQMREDAPELPTEITEAIPTVMRDISETWDVMGLPAQEVLAKEAGIAETVVGTKFAELTSVQQNNLRAVHERARVTQPITEAPEAMELKALHNDPTRMAGLRNSTSEEATAYINRLKKLAETEGPKINLKEADFVNLNQALREVQEGDLATAGELADKVLTRIHKLYKLAHPEFELAQPIVEAEIEGLSELLATDLVATISANLEKIDATLEEGKSIGLGAASFKNMREQVARAMFEQIGTEGFYKDAKSLNQHLDSLSDTEIKKLYNRYVNKLEKPPAMVEAEHRAKYAERTGMPKGYLESVSANLSPEQVNQNIANEFFYPIKDSPFDVAVTEYLRTGDFNAMVRLLPRVDELKLQALGETVLTNIDELNTTIEGIESEITRQENELALGELSKKDIKTFTENISILNADIKRLESMIKELRRGKKFTIEDAAALGVALRETKGGKILPALRQSGFYANVEFAESEYLRDINYALGQTESTIALFEHIDGGYVARLSEDGKGVAQKYILWPTHRAVEAGMRFNAYYQQEVHNALDRFNMLGLSKEQRQDFVDVIEVVTSEAADFKTKQLLSLPKIKEITAKYSPQTRSDMVEASQWVRAFLDDMIVKQNAVRESRNQDPIAFRRRYLPEIAERNIWHWFGIGKKTPADLIRKPPIPDFIVPNQPFNPREQARKGGMEGYLRETNVQKLLFGYIHTAMKDIFYTGAIHNTKIHTAVMRARGMENSARLIEDWVVESYAGTNSHLTRGLEAALPRKGLKGIFAIRRNLTRAVFPLNVRWNLTIQPSSAVFTLARAGFRNSTKALDVFISSQARKQAEATNSYIIKTAQAGKMAYQDIGGQLGRHSKYEATIIDKAEKAGNFLTNTIEKYLTMWSVRAGYYLGRDAGLTGRALQEFASTMGAKTQSMYNREGKPAWLRSNIITSLFPFQTFMFESFNFVRETAPVLPEKLRTGAYRDVRLSSKPGQALLAKRMKVWATFLACIFAVNMIVDRLTGRKPWVISSFIPFYAILQGVTDPTNPWNYPLPIQYGADFWKAFESYIKYENWDKIRKWLLRYHMLGGTQFNRIIEGSIAIAEGKVTDVKGEKLYDVESDEWFKAILSGPYATEGGQEFIDAMYGEESFWEQWFGIQLPSRVNIDESVNDMIDLLGTETLEGDIYHFGDLVSGIREIRNRVGSNRFNDSDNPIVIGFRQADKYSTELEKLLEGVEDVDKRSEIRVNFRQSNPLADAYLSLYAFDGRIQSLDAYNRLVNLANGMDIPLDYLDTFVPPENIASSYFEYIDVLGAGFTSNSAEAKLVRLKNEDFDKWGQEAYGWEPATGSIPALEITVKWRNEFDEYEAIQYDDEDKQREEREQYLADNPEFRDDRRRREAYLEEIPDTFVENYVEYYQGDSRDQMKYRMTHLDFDEMMGDSEIRGDKAWESSAKDFADSFATDEVASLIEQYEALIDEAGEADTQARRLFRINNPLLDAYFVYADGYKPASNATLDISLSQILEWYRLGLGVDMKVHGEAIPEGATRDISEFLQ